MISRQRPVFPAFDPADYIELADELASRPEQATKRTAADRAYYAAFLISREQLTAKGYIIPHYGSQDHEDVTETLKRKDLLGTYGNQEFRLRKARNRVTYDIRDLTYSQEQPSLKWMIATAKEIINRVLKIPAYSPEK
ncbi:unnamed protein product [marine sediment metagenome]|uniref:HEPN domain-containing protein n=1 Tax=marine sediment metagenome TaxID=412755 RepID=X1EQ52_9ZZZZ